MKSTKTLMLSLLAIGVSIATSIRSYDFIYRIIRDDFYAITGLITLECGVFFWFFFFKKAESSWQMTIAGSMIVISLLGIGVASVGDIFLKSAVTSQPAQFWIDIAVAFISGLLVLNMLALIGYEITEPAFWQNFKNKLAQIKINEQATLQIDANADKIAGTVALHRGNNWTNQILEQEGIKALPAGQKLELEMGGQGKEAEQRHPLPTAGAAWLSNPKPGDKNPLRWVPVAQQPKTASQPATITTAAADGSLAAGDIASGLPNTD